MNKAILGSLAVLPLVTATVFTNAGSANAQLVGEFHISPGINLPQFTVTNATLFSNKLTFTPDPGTLFLSNQTGSFTAFNGATIKSIPELPTNTTDKANPLVANFLDLGNFFPYSSLTDGKNTFSLLSVGSYSIQEMFDHGNFTGTSISLGLSGFFTDANDKISKGAGTLTFQSSQRKAGVESALASNKGLNASFSGVFFTASVPEPTTLAGLGLVAGSLMLSRSKKKNKAE